MNFLFNECETLRDVRIHKHTRRQAWILTAIDPFTMRGTIMTIDDDGANLEPPAYGGQAQARAMAAGSKRRFVLPLMPTGVLLAATRLAHENRLTAMRKIELWRWLREALPHSQHGARMGYDARTPWLDVPVRVAVVPLDRGGYTPDGTYYGLRQRGQCLYALHQERADGTDRQLVGTLDADCRDTALAKAKAWADERGLSVYRMPAQA